MTRHIAKKFESVGSGEALAAFVSEFGLQEQPTTRGDQRSYSGSASGQSVEVHERWWDTSHAYRIGPDRHEATLHIGGVKVATIRFDGSS